MYVYVVFEEGWHLKTVYRTLEKAKQSIRKMHTYEVKFIEQYKEKWITNPEYPYGEWILKILVY